MSEEKKYVEAGSRIAKVRGELSQADFAARVGVDRKTVVRWEAGERLPDGGSLLRLRAEFNADVNYILTGPIAPSTALKSGPEPVTDRARLAAALAAVEEGLSEARRRLPPGKKAELVLAAYDLISGPDASRENVIRLVRLAA